MRMPDIATKKLSCISQWWRQHCDVAGKISISVFLVAYYGLTFINISPNAEGPLNSRLREPTHVICEFFGWMQNWRLFGPLIRTINFHTFALIGYENGMIGSWEAPRFDLMNLNEKYRKDKFHKWDSDCLPWFNYHNFWPGFARWLGNLHYDPGNKPVWCLLLRYESDIPDPRQGKILEHDAMPPRTRLLNSFLYHYQPEDFK